jgi:hypothetical protein
MLILVVLLANVTRATTMELDLGSGDVLVIDAPQNILVKNVPATQGKPLIVKLADTNGQCEMRLMFATPAAIPTKEEMKTNMLTSGARLLTNSEEKQIEIKELPSKSLTFVYFELADKRQNAKDGRFMLQGIGTDGKKYMFQYMMLSNLKDSNAKTQILETISKMRIEKKKK